MKRVIVIGSPGAGKSTFSRRKTTSGVVCLVIKGFLIAKVKQR